MTGRNKFSGLTENLSLERRVKIEMHKIDLREEMALHELRKVLDKSQADLAARLDVNQPAITKMEHRTDIRISSLKRMIEAMGGSLEIKACFPQGDVTITNYRNT